MKPDKITHDETKTEDATPEPAPLTPQQQAHANLMQLAHLCIDLLGAQSQGG